jgi:hypothetical protein
MLGESNLVKPDSGMKILYRGTLNTLGALGATALTQDNLATAQAQANTTLSASTPKGLLSGSVAAAVGAGEIGACDASKIPVGLIVNDAAGYPYESASGVGSGKAVYLHGSGSVVAVDVYETRNAANNADLTYAAGEAVYSSAQGLLTNEGSSNAVGVILEPPTPASPVMVVQLSV